MHNTFYLVLNSTPLLTIPITGKNKNEATKNVHTLKFSSQQTQVVSVETS